MANITKEHAQVICKKLGAVDETSSGAAHERHCVYHGKILLGHIGIRHGSKRDQSHDHIPKDLNVSPRFALELATCTKSRDEYLEKVGVIQPPDSDASVRSLSSPQYPWQKDWVAIQAEEAKRAKGGEAPTQGRDSE
jgi:hypothetical protein